MAILENISDAIGNTPLVRINTLNGGGAEIYAKVEAFNPLSSVKDRLGNALINDAVASGALLPGGTIVEATSGNTGIALAYISAAKGYKLVLTMPESMSVERRNLLKALGAELVLTPAEKGMKGSIDAAHEIAASRGALLMGQFDNPANPTIHEETTGPEIWEATEGNVDMVVSSVGTGGTVTGIARALSSKGVKIIAVEPASSAVLSGGKPGPHKIQGIGAGFIPKVLEVELLDEVVQVADDAAGIMARRAAKEEGLLVGISSGAALVAAIELSNRPENAGKKIVVILPDSGERYLSTWLFQE